MAKNEVSKEVVINPPVVHEDSTMEYCSLAVTTKKETATLFNALQNPTHGLGECNGQVIKIKHVILTPGELQDEDTKEFYKCTRVTLFDEKGETYSTPSKSFLRTLMNAFQVYGLPHTWEEPLEIQVQLKASSTTAKNKYLTFAIVAE